MEVSKELDAKVLAAMGWTLCYDDTYWHPPADSHWGKRLQYAGIIVSDLGIISTSDAEAVQLCLPWLVERNEGHPVTILAYRKHARVGVWSHIEFIDGGTLAHALCLAVIAVAAREAEQREPTT